MTRCPKKLLRSLVGVAPLALLLQFCAAPASAPSDADVEELGPNAAMIRLPVDHGELDSVNVAKLDFAQGIYEFGEVDAGAVVKHEFTFVNGGRVPLLIATARSTCGCTVPSYPQAPVQPGESGVISVAFDTKNKSGLQRKPVIITANTYPAETTLYVSGRVTKK